MLKDTGLSLGAGSTPVKRPRIVAELWYSPSPEQTEHNTNTCKSISHTHRSYINAALSTGNIDAYSLPVSAHESTGPGLQI